MRNWVERLARVGFAAKGAIYLVVGGLALRFAVSDGGRLTDPHGAVAAILARPYGRIAVGAVAVGLSLYAAWRFLEAFADANRKGRDRRALASRAMAAMSGAVYGVLSYDAAVLAFAPRGGGGGGGHTELPSTLIGGELARWAAVLVALGLAGYGVAQVKRAFDSHLSDQLSASRVERHAGSWTVLVSRIGMGGRAVVLILMGLVLGRRAMTSADAAAKTDTGDSLRLVAALPTGDLLLAVIAAGLMAYGVFQLVHARYRTITPP